MNTKFRVIIKEKDGNEVYQKIVDMNDIVYGVLADFGYESHTLEIIRIDRDTGLKDVDGNTIFENDKLYSDKLIKPITVTYDKEHGLWTDNTFTEELWKSIQKFKLKTINVIYK